MAASLVSHLSGRAGPWLVLAAAACCSALLFSAAQAADAPTQLAAPAPAPRVLTLHDKVVAALRGVGHYGAMSGLLDSLGESAIIKPGITLFAPDDVAFSGIIMNNTGLLQTELDYQIATTVYTNQQLASLPLNSTIQTAAAGVVIFVTSTGNAGVRLDGVAISVPDLYTNAQVAVHGVSSLFDTAKYNKGVVVPPAAAPLARHAPSTAPVYITTVPSPPVPDKNDAAHATLNRVFGRALVLVISSALVMILPDM